MSGTDRFAARKHTSMSQVGGKLYVSACQADNSVVHNIAANFGTQFPCLQACQVNHLHDKQCITSVEPKFKADPLQQQKQQVQAFRADKSVCRA